jgi:small subunit ribosomal protein S14
MEIQRENRNIHDDQHRQLAAKCELKHKLFKVFLRDPDLPTEVREQMQYKLAKLPRNSSFTRIRNRCIFTGHPRGVY